MKKIKSHFAYPVHPIHPSVNKTLRGTKSNYYGDLFFKVRFLRQTRAGPRRKDNAVPRREILRCGATFNPLQFYKKSLKINNTKKRNPFKNERQK